MNSISKLSLFLFFVFLYSCSKEAIKTESKLFQKKEATQTGINFNNKLTETEKLNYFNFPYYNPKNEMYII